MIKAGSLIYAVYVCLLISILSGALLFIYNLNIELSGRQALQSDLVDLCESCSEYYLSDPKHFQNLVSQRIDLLGTGSQCEFSKIEWGYFKLLTVKSYFKNDTLRKSAFVGSRAVEDNLALFLCDWDEKLKLSGTSKIVGDMKLPASGHTSINILGNSQLNKPILSGKITKSTQSLSKIKKPDINFTIENGVLTGLPELNGKSTIINDFDEPTLIVDLQLGEQLDNLSFKGNILLKSVDTLFINSSTKLEDIIVQAPKVVIENGFKGRAQVFAHEEILIEEGALLSYPSTLAIIPNKNGARKKITLSKDSRVYGGVVIDGTTFDEKENNEIIIEKDALIVGDLYCNGKLQLQGNVLGSVHAHKFKLDTKSGSYGNVLLNGTINAVDLPKKYIRLPLFGPDKNQAYGIIKIL